MKDHFERQRDADGAAPQWQPTSALLRRYMLGLKGLKAVPSELWSVPRAIKITTSPPIIGDTPTIDDNDEEEFQ